ncbi:MAG: FeoB-associated Cys-rich membrane protein [Lachnospiraceae bacterium]|nr:FeoB-associated Cys-rich membrane protein [Lachnospiraceae bacterium]
MNIWDIVLTVIIILAVALAIVHIVRAKRRGECTCGGNCAGCSAPCRRENNEK